ncbi:nucleotidyltransferase domain-containing protein [Paenarthrobacter sp. NPDC089989]|uniref:nucleotidyltransferase domain-containing protein n=1 Tax=unclassified Paenarthrobacter TaxID=2634190 RepID=UPI003802F8FD
MALPFSDGSPVSKSSPIEIARTYVEQHHPGASASILGGSAAAGTTMSTSDLDIAVLYPSGHSNYAATTRFRGWLVEEFVHTHEILEFWYQKEAAERRPVIPDLCARGILLTDNGTGRQLQKQAREHMAQGPKVLEDSERSFRRYNLSALIDDLVGSQDNAERFAVSSDVFRDAAELFLLESGSWLGSGKWTIRRLHLNGSELALRLCSWAEDSGRNTESLVGLAREVLDLSGGYIQEGFIRGQRNERADPLET